MKRENPIPPVKAWSLIALLTLLISGSAWLVFGVYSSFFSVRTAQSKYNIVAIVQTGPEKEALKTAYLAELLGLSIDKPSNLYQFDLAAGREKLKASPIIKEAELKRIPPSTLYIDYTTRKPVAYVGDLSNTAIDREKKIFPFNPFYTSKKLPKLILGIEPAPAIKWGQVLDNERVALAFVILEAFLEMGSKEMCSPLTIDVSRVESPSYGLRQIVIELEEWVNAADGWVPKRRALILNPDSFLDGLDRFTVLKHSGQWNKLANASVIDLRLPSLAYVTEEGA